MTGHGINPTYEQRLLQMQADRVEPGPNEPSVISIRNDDRIFNANIFLIGTKKLHFAEFGWLVKTFPENGTLDPILVPTVQAHSYKELPV